MSELKDSEKLQMVMSHLKINSRNFALQIGVAVSTISQIAGLKSAPTRNMGADLKLKIVTRYPEINYAFLDSGKLPMLLSEKLKTNQKNLLSGEKKDFKAEIIASIEENNNLLARNNELLENLIELMKQEKTS